MKNAKWQIILFCGFLGLFLLWFPMSPDREFSEMENRNLQQRPAFSWEKLHDSSFTAEVDTYFADQFPMRDQWTALKSATERVWGRTENNGVYLAGDRLLEKIEEPEAERVEKNLAAVNHFTQLTDRPVFLMLVPTAIEIYRDTLPYGAPTADENRLLDGIYAGTQAQTIDLRKPLAAHKDDYIFYRTDHHWTSLGAYFGATALREALGEPAVPLASYTPERVTEDFNGTLFSSSGYRGVTPDVIDYYVPDVGYDITSYRTGSPEKGTLYDRSYLAKKDKYSSFFGGNQPLCVIKNENEGKRLLLVRDSYADSLSPFLFDAFSEVHLFDARYYKMPLTQYIEENQIDEVVFLFSVKNFVTNTELPMVCK